ncbi:MAG TPA: pyridoxamine 5'-phosphate oxidase family protein [Acidimicrobiia bacterium]|nr:pyridoxamine 5'-phosphate oxidase family protein [Acidimicrobiia bacterium]
MSIRLSRDEAWEVLRTTHTGIFTSLKADGTPITLPVWFAVLDGRIYVDAVATTKKVARIRRNPRVSFLVESGQRWRELRGVHLTGQARIVADPELTGRFRAVMGEKYAGFSGDRAAMPEESRGHYEREHLVIEIEPDERILSYDNARIPLAPTSSDEAPT